MIENEWKKFSQIDHEIKLFFSFSEKMAMNSNIPVPGTPLSPYQSGFEIPRLYSGKSIFHHLIILLEFLNYLQSKFIDGNSHSITIFTIPSAQLLKITTYRRQFVTQNKVAISQYPDLFMYDRLGDGRKCILDVSASAFGIC